MHILMRIKIHWDKKHALYISPNVRPIELVFAHSVSAPDSSKYLQKALGG